MSTTYGGNTHGYIPGGRSCMSMRNSEFPILTIYGGPTTPTESLAPTSPSTYSSSSGPESKLKAWQSFLIFTGYMSIFWTFWVLMFWAMGMEFKWVAAFGAISFAITGFVPCILLCIISPPYDHDAVIKSKKIRKCVSTIIVWIALFGIWFCFNYGWNEGEIRWHIFPWMP